MPDRPAAETLWRIGDEQHRRGLGRDRNECVVCDRSPPCEYEISELRVRLAHAERALAAVGALHKRGGTTCTRCETAFPCGTVRAARGGQDA